MSTRYRVAQGGCVAIRMPGQTANTLLHPGQYLPDGMDRSVIESHIKSGHVVPENRTDYPNKVEDKFVENPPGVETPPAVSSKEDIQHAVITGDPGPAAKPDAIVTGTPGGIQVETSSKSAAAAGAAAPVQQVNSHWNLDPATLADKTLEQLNVMVLERDPKIAPFETVEEASAFLSQDFKP